MLSRKQLDALPEITKVALDWILEHLPVSRELRDPADLLVLFDEAAETAPLKVMTQLLWPGGEALEETFRIQDAINYVWRKKVLKDGPAMLKRYNATEAHSFLPVIVRVFPVDERHGPQIGNIRIDWVAWRENAPREQSQYYNFNLPMSKPETLEGLMKTDVARLRPTTSAWSDAHWRKL